MADVAAQARRADCPLALLRGWPGCDEIEIDAGTVQLGSVVCSCQGHVEAD